ncbi:lantibiotic dehydratase [Fodinicola acaciae]|uniref:lantibiotic dehydratase n=1 Tax=Fodinicola acaciae TaxID=2681555 RepID=UPI0013D62443|nr:lantibiotic dehydratase [Fodinicola acaciae]
MQQPLFAAGEVFVLRAPAVMPKPVADPADRVGDFLREAAADRIFLEALAISSPSTAAAIAADDPHRRRRVALTTSRYQLRMRSRATPFGLLSGVAAGRPGPTCSVVFGSAHEKAARPSGEWVAAYAAGCAGRPQDFPAATVRLHPLCRPRGDRLTLPDIRGTGAESIREASIRRTPPVCAVEQLASARISLADLVNSLTERFAELPVERLWRFVGALISAGFLACDLWPEQSDSAPLEHFVAHCGPDNVLLTEAVDALSAYRKTKLGDGLELRDRAAAAMGRLTGEEPAGIQVDLGLDARLTLPPVVLQEIEAATTALWRLSPSREAFTGLSDYHQEFVERYGIGAAVPILDVLDPVAGLGAPGGYRRPAGHREAPDRRAPKRQGIADLAMLVHAGADEIELSASLLEKLDAEPDGTVWPSADVSCQLLAASPAAVDAGDFRVNVTPVAWQAGQMSGRFAELTGLTADLAAMLEKRLTGGRPVQLQFQPADPRTGNVGRVPRLLPALTSISGLGGDLSIGDIGIAADLDGLYAVSLVTGEEIAPTPMTMINLEGLTPNPVRLLTELAFGRARRVMPWSWGPLDELPRLPRVRYGRAILMPARWLPVGLTGADARRPDWPQRLASWREQLEVPDRVLVGDVDQRLGLDLSDSWHRELLRTELERRPEALVSEDFSSEYGWIAGRPHEIIVPVFARRQREPVTGTTGPTRPPAYAPGGDWLYARISTAPDAIDALLPELVPQLPLSDVDRWFFIRYNDPRPHLRLRFHRPSAELLPALHDAVSRARDRGLAGGLELGTYEPETARYGSGQVLAAAERVFCADSHVVFEQLGHKRDREVTAVLHYLDILSAFCPDGWKDWLVHAIDPAGRKELDRNQRRQVFQSLDSLTGEAISQRRQALRDYASLLREAGQPSWQVVAMSLLHMHFNRAYGIAPPTERRSLSLLREVTHGLLVRR